jgi:Flp pilus assembly protein TadB
MRRSAFVLVSLLALLLGVPGIASAAPTPTIVLSGLTTTPGQARFLLTPRDLPAGVSLDPASVRVSADQTDLRAQTAPATDTVGAPARILMVVLDINGTSSSAYRSAARAAAAALAQSLPADVQIGLFTVATQPTQALAPTTDRGAFNDAVSTVVYNGGLDPVEGVEAARKALAGTAGSGDRRLLLFTDARQTFVDPRNAQIGASVAGTGLGLDVVGLGAAGSGLGVLTELATAAGGQVINAADQTAAVAGWREVGARYSPILAVTVSVPNALSGSTAVLQVEVAGSAGFSARSAVTATFAVSAIPGGPSATPVLGWVPDWLLYVVGVVVFLALAAIVLALAWPRSDAHIRIKQIANFGDARGAGTARNFGDARGAGPARNFGDARGAGTARDFGPGRAAPPPKVEPAAPQPAPTGGRITRTALAASASVVRTGNFEERIGLRLERAGMRLRPHEWLLVRTLVTVGVGVLFGLLGGLIAALVGLVVGWLSTVAYQQLLVDRRARLFAEQLPDGLQLIIGSLRSGFSLSQALESLVREGPQPVASEFGRALAEHRLGADVSDALDRVAQRAQSEDLAWAVMAVRIQRDVGGNLAEILQTSVETMRERGRLRRHVRSLSAEGRLSAYVLIVVPLALGLFMFVYRRSYLMPLFTDPRGILLAAGGGVLFVIGIVWMTRVIRVEA